MDVASYPRTVTVVVVLFPNQRAEVLSDNEIMAIKAVGNEFRIANVSNEECTSLVRIKWQSSQRKVLVLDNYL